MILQRQNAIPDPDARDVSLARGGDRDAFARLVERYQRLILQISYQYTSDSTEAEDVAQETFLKAYRALGQFRADCRFSSWLCRICINTAHDMTRSRSRHRTVSLTVDEDGEERQTELRDTDAGGDPALTLERKEECRMVREAMASLSEEHRLILTLRDMEDRSYEEIAQITSLNIGTVKSRINRARAALKKILTERNFSFSLPSNGQNDAERG